MLNTTLCYLERDGAFLMMHRIIKKNDLNHDKWIGVGGKFLENESPDECLLREVREETGLTLTSWRIRGIVTFVSDRYETEQMYLFTAGGFDGTPGPCDEGVLEWVPKAEAPKLPVWEGDRIFFTLLAEDHPFFLLRLEYEGDRLVSAVLDGKKIVPAGSAG